MVTLRIVGLGDSTTAGTPGFRSPVEAPPSGRGKPESQYGYWVMKLHPDWIFLNKGVNGERSDQILSRFQPDVVDEHLQVVVILAGVNDIFQGRSASSVEKNLEAMYSLAERHGILPFGATVLPYDIAGHRESAAIRELNAWIQKVSVDRGMDCCDTNLAARAAANEDRLASTPDGLHPDVNGYRRMGEAVASVLERRFI